MARFANLLKNNPHREDQRFTVYYDCEGVCNNTNCKKILSHTIKALTLSEALNHAIKAQNSAIEELVYIELEESVNEEWVTIGKWDVFLLPTPTWISLI